MRNIADSVYGFIIGDAYGVPFEFLKRNTFECTKMIECNENSIHDVPFGTFSDDTSLMLCVMDALCEHDEKQIYERYKENSIDWMFEGKFTADGDFPFDIGGACRNGIIAMKTGIPNYLADDVNSNGNGGLMKILPLAFLDLSNEELIEYEKMFNSCSHNHIISHAGCFIYLKIVQNLLAGKDLKSAIDINVPEEFNLTNYKNILNKTIFDLDINSISSTGYVVHTLEAAIWAVSQSKDFEDAIKIAVNLGDDTDTVAAITGSIAGIIYDVPKKLKNNILNRKLIDKVIDNFQKERLESLENLVNNVNTKNIEDIER